MNKSKLIYNLLILISSLILLVSCDECKFENITPDDLPTAKINSNYNVMFREKTTVCTPSRVNIWLNSGDLPPGLTLYPNGELKGKISANAETKVYNFTIKMEVCFNSNNPNDYSNCSSLTKGYALKVE